MAWPDKSVRRKTFFAFIIFLLSACSAKPHVVRSLPEQAATDSTSVYVVSHGWHTGFVVPTTLIQAQVPELKDRFPDATYLELGWGDKGFYQAQEITSSLSVQAIFWPTESVMHVVAVPQSVEQYFRNSQIEKLCLGGSDYASLILFIKNSFQRNAHGEIVKQRKGIYGDSQFYRGEGDYYLMNTCNIWTAKGLKSAGLDIEPRFKLGADSVMDYLQVRRESVSEQDQAECAAAATRSEAYHSIK